MMSFDANPVSNPLQFIDSHFERTLQSSLGDKMRSEDLDASGLFEELIADESFKSSVPFFVRGASVKSGRHSLVRYVGLVQDVMDPEYYIGIYHQRNSAGCAARTTFTKYREHVQMEKEGAASDIHPTQSEQIFERVPVVCIPVPGQSSWCRQYIYGEGKETREEDVRDDAACGWTGVRGHESDHALLGQKRAVEEVSEYGLNKDVDKPSGPYPDASAIVKIYDRHSGSVCSEGGGAGNRGGSERRMVRMHDMVEILGVLYQPVPPGEDTEGVGSKRVKQAHYCETGDDVENGSVGMVDVSGMHVTDVTSLFTNDGEDDDNDSLLMHSTSMYGPAECLMERHPAVTSSLPIIHCVMYRVLGSSFPLYAAISSTSKLSITTPARALGPLHASSDRLVSGHEGELYSSVELSDAEGLVRQHIQEALLGDELSAYYVCLCIVSKSYSIAGSSVHNAQSTTQALGVLPLNLYNLSRDDIRVSRLSRALGAVVPRMVEISITIDILNDSDFSLEKNCFTNAFSISPLQLAPGTVLVVNECGMSEGKLSPTGIKNLKCLRDILRYQTLEANFQYYGLKYPVSVAVLILSNKPSLLCFEGIVSVRCVSLSDNQLEARGYSTMESLHDDNSSADDVTLDAMRTWWSESMQIDDVSMHESMFAVAEDAFVDMRQQAAESDTGVTAVTVDDFQRMLTTARLCAVADSCREIGICHWEKMMRIERERSSRNNMPS